MKIEITLENFTKAIEYAAKYIDRYCEREGFTEEEKLKFLMELSCYNEGDLDILLLDDEFVDEIVSIMTDGYDVYDVDEFGVCFDEDLEWDFGLDSDVDTGIEELIQLALTEVIDVD